MQSVTVAVVSICGAGHLRRCLDGLAPQVDAPPFDVVVVYDPSLCDVPRLGEHYPEVRFVANEGQHSPLELASRAVREASGDTILLTEDHCIPKVDWVRRMLDAQRPGRGAVGGLVETGRGVGPLNWAFYFVDFFRYAGPRIQGPSRSLTVCNVAYRREYLDKIADTWRGFFHETAVNEALRRRFGPLWLVPDSEVRTSRRVGLMDAIHERYAFGRLFGCTRTQFCGLGHRAYYAVFAPCLPLLLGARMLVTAAVRPRLWKSFGAAIPALAVLILAESSRLSPMAK